MDIGEAAEAVKEVLRRLAELVKARARLRGGSFRFREKSCEKLIFDVSQAARRATTNHAEDLPRKNMFDSRVAKRVLGCYSLSRYG